MIPKQLQNHEFRFVRIAFKTKKPIKEEAGWRIRGGLKFDDPILLEHISQHKNYGISGGYGNLYLLDSDIPLIGELIEQKFGQTFRVKSGSGKGFHDYFIIKGGQLYRTITFDKDGKHYGELRGDGNYVVCPGSVHPSGGTYEVLRDLPIKEINYPELMEYLKEYSNKISKQRSKVVDTTPRKDYGEYDIHSISLGSVFGSNQKRIANPWHGSTTGKNLVINYSDGVWHCKRCDAGGGVAEAIALNEGIIHSCGEGLDTERFKEVLKIAREKYGLKQPIKTERNPAQVKQPKGWARSLKIKTIAEKYGITKCPECSGELWIDDNYGAFKCRACGCHGGLKRLLMYAILSPHKEALS